MVRVCVYRFNTHAGVGELESVRIGDDLEENIVLVEDVGQLSVASIICHNLRKNNSVRNAA